VGCGDSHGHHPHQRIACRPWPRLSCVDQDLAIPGVGAGTARPLHPRLPGSGRNRDDRRQHILRQCLQQQRPERNIDRSQFDRLCVALLAPERVDDLIGALTAWRALP
jgi:hypothetical protein